VGHSLRERKGKIRELRGWKELQFLDVRLLSIRGRGFQGVTAPPYACPLPSWVFGERKQYYQKPFEKNGQRHWMWKRTGGDTVVPLILSSCMSVQEGEDFEEAHS